MYSYALPCNLKLFGFFLPVYGPRYTTMSRHISSVVDIKPGMKKSWTVLVQILEIAHAQTSRSGKTEFKRLILADAQGTLFNVVIFKGDFQHYACLLIPYKRYYISNTVLSTNDSPYRIGAYEYSWILNSRTLVEGLVEPSPPALAYRFDFTPFDNLHKFADADDSHNVRAVVLHCFPSQEHASESKISTKRDVVIVNEDKKLMLLTLWDKFDDHEGNSLANMIESGPVIYGMRLRVTTFNSLSLSTRMSSGLMINPPTDEASKMKEWYNENRQELQELLKDKSYKNPALLLPYPKDEDIVPVASVASSLDTFRTAWVKGKTSFPKQDRSPWFTVCANCQKTLEADISWLVTCPSCKIETQVEAKSRITILIHGDGTSLRATTCSPDAENLMPFTAEQLKEAEDKDIDLHNEIATAVRQHTIVAFIRSNESTFHGQPQTNINIIKAYESRDVALLSKTIASPTGLESCKPLAGVTQTGSSKGNEQPFDPCTPSKPVNKSVTSSKKEAVANTIPGDAEHAGTLEKKRKYVTQLKCLRNMQPRRQKGAPLK